MGAEMAVAVIARSNHILEREIIAPLEGSGTPLERLMITPETLAA